MVWPTRVEEPSEAWIDLGLCGQIHVAMAELARTDSSVRWKSLLHGISAHVLQGVLAPIVRATSMSEGQIHAAMAEFVRTE